MRAAVRPPGPAVPGPRFSFPMAARPGAARPGRAGVAALPAAGSRAAAARREAAEPREAGDADQQGRSCGDRRRHPVRRATDLRPDRVRAEALVVGVFLRPRALGVAGGARFAMAADRADASDAQSTGT